MGNIIKLQNGHFLNLDLLVRTYEDRDYDSYNYSTYARMSDGKDVKLTEKDVASIDSYISKEQA